MTCTQPLVESVTSGSRSVREGHWHAVVDAASYAMSASVDPPIRPTQLANNHAWHNQINIGEHLFAAARGGADGTTGRSDAGKASRKGVQVAA